MLHQSEAGAILADLREVERHLAVVQRLPANRAGYDELLALHAEARRLRDEYKALVEVARLRGRPVGPPWPPAIEP